MGPPVQRGGLGEARHAVLRRRIGRGVGARGVRRDGAIVDDAPAPRRLRLHHAKRFLRAKKRAGEVHVHHRPPLVDGELLKRHRRGTPAGVVEQHVQAAEASLRLREQVGDGLWVGNVRPHHQRPLTGTGFVRRLPQQRLPPPRQRHRIALVQERERRGPAYPAARSGDDGHAQVVR